MNMIKTLYANPSAHVCIGGGFSELFDIKQGKSAVRPFVPPYL